MSCDYILPPSFADRFSFSSAQGFLHYIFPEWLRRAKQQRQAIDDILRVSDDALEPVERSSLATAPPFLLPFVVTAYAASRPAHETVMWQQTREMEHTERLLRNAVASGADYPDRDLMRDAAFRRVKEDQTESSQRSGVITRATSTWIFTLEQVILTAPDDTKVGRMCMQIITPRAASAHTHARQMQVTQTMTGAFECDVSLMVSVCVSCVCVLYQSRYLPFSGSAMVVPLVRELHSLLFQSHEAKVPVLLFHKELLLGLGVINKGVPEQLQKIKAIRRRLRAFTTHLMALPVRPERVAANAAAPLDPAVPTQLTSQKDRAVQAAGAAICRRHQRRMDARTRHSGADLSGGTRRRARRRSLAVDAGGQGTFVSAFPAARTGATWSAGVGRSASASASGSGSDGGATCTGCSAIGRHCIQSFYLSQVQQEALRWRTQRHH